jgi:hypothetical protein
VNDALIRIRSLTSITNELMTLRVTSKTTSTFCSKNGKEYLHTDSTRMLHDIMRTDVKCNFLHIPDKIQFFVCVFFDPLRPSGNYTYHLILQSVTLHFVFVCFA